VDVIISSASLVGNPHCGQWAARSENTLPHSGHFISDILQFNYFTVIIASFMTIFTFSFSLLARDAFGLIAAML
jgi:hypothetical protein